MNDAHDSLPRGRVLALVGVQVLLVMALFGAKTFTVVTGETVILETAPVDPRDLFRGDYVDLSYAISTLTLGNADDYDRGDRIYVLLEQRGRYHEAVSVHHGRPATGPDQVCLKGTVDWADAGGGPGDGGPRLQVSYGLESYFIPEGVGEPERTATIDAQVKVDFLCHAVIEQLLVDGEPWDP